MGPLRSQSDVHRFIERVITEDSLDLADIYVGYGASCSDESSAEPVPLRSDHGEHSLLSRDTSQCKLAAVGLPSEMLDVSARQTLQEIDPNKQLTGLGQSSVVPRHSEEIGVNASADSCCGENSVDEMDACAEVKNVAISEELDASVTRPCHSFVKPCSRLSEINNNRRLTSPNIVQQRDVDSPKLALRKSKRCNRGQRYKELVSQGVLHQPRKKQDMK